MKSLASVLSIVFGLCLLLTSCGDPSPIGAGVLDGERLDITFTDTIPLKAKTIEGDRLATFRRGSSTSVALNLQNRIVGQLDDPLMGTSSSEVYLRLELPTGEANFDRAVIDSIVLSILYDSVGFYGDRDALHSVEVSQLTEAFPYVDTIFSDDPIVKGSVLGSRIFTPRFNDSTRIIQHGQGTPSFLAPQLRIRLDDAFGQQILDNEALIETDTTFSVFLPGIVISSSPDNSSTFGLNLLRTTNAGPSNGMTLFYTIDDTIKTSYRFEISSDIASYIEHDITGSAVEPFLNAEDLGDSLIFVQGLAGLDAEVEIGGLDAIAEDVINQATLIAFIYRDPMLNPEYYTPQPLLLAEENEEGNLISIEDFNIAIQSGRVQELFGGSPQDTIINGQALEYIQMNVTSFLKELIANEKSDPATNRKLILNVTSKVQRPGRTILYGPGHSLYPMKLNVTFTDIN